MNGRPPGRPGRVQSPVTMLIKLSLGVLIIYALVCALVFLKQRSLIYFPQPAAPGIKLPVINLATAAGPVRVGVQARDGAQALLYFGGNAENVDFALAQLGQAFADHAIYLMHYRGYGGSAGEPSEAALVADAQALFDLVHARHPQVTVMGRSLGTGVAVQLASQREVTRLLLVTPYDSLVGLGARRFPYLPVRWLQQERFESCLFAPRVRAPTLILMAEHDEVIPRQSTEHLQSCFSPGVARVLTLGGVGHNSISDHPAYAAALKGNTSDTSDTSITN